MDIQLKKRIDEALDHLVHQSSSISARLEIKIQNSIDSIDLHKEQISSLSQLFHHQYNLESIGTLFLVSQLSFDKIMPFISNFERELKLLNQLNEYQSQLGSAHQKLDIMQTILDELPEMIAVKNLNEEYIISNQKANQLFKNRFDTIVGHKVSELYGVDEQPRVLGMDQETIHQMKPIHREFVMKSPTGSFLAEALRLPAFSKGGDLIGIISINRNIEEMKQIQYQLRNSLSFQDTLIKIALEFINVHEDQADQAIEDTLAVAGLHINADRVYVFDYDFINNTTSNTYEWCAEGVTPEIENLQNYPIDDIEDLWLKHHRKGEMVYIQDLEAISHDEVIYQYLAPQGIKSILTIPLFHHGELIGFAGFDSTRGIRHWSEEDRKLLQIMAELIVNLKVKIQNNQELIRQREKAEQYSNAKTQFLANMSHEIRTPLSGIYSAINLLLGTNFTQKQLEYLELAKVSIETLTGIVNDILDISRIEQGKLTVDLQFFSLESELFQIAKLQELLVREKGLEFIYRFDYRIRHHIEFDRVRLRQIMINLTHNAIKFTDKGSITMDVKMIAEDDSYYYVKLSVDDTGVGIPKNALPHITDAFYQADQSTIKEFQGTGLGLSIVKEILNHFKVNLIIDSTENVGTSMSFTLKLKKGNPLFDQHHLQGKKILIVQDDQFPNDMGLHFYQSLDMDVQCVPVTRLKSVEKQLYDYIVFELDLHNFDKSFIDQVKQKSLKQDAKFVLCNLIGKPYEEDDLLTFGIDYKLDFPLTREKTLILLENNTSHSDQVKDDQRLSMVFNHEKILIVDDNPVNLMALTHILENEGFIVNQASSGHTAISMVQNHSYDMILMDIQMPQMDGYETTRIIRGLGYTNSMLPIIAVTANLAHQVIEKVKQSDMNDFISKPYNPEALLQMIAMHLQKVSSNLVQKMIIPDKLKAFNAETLMMLFKNKSYLGEKVISAFFEEYGTNVQNLKNALEKNDYIEISKLAHYLKGSASYAAAERVVWICEELMKEAQKEKHERVNTLINLIDHEIQDWIYDVNQWQKGIKK